MTPYPDQSVYAVDTVQRLRESLAALEHTDPAPEARAASPPVTVPALASSARRARRERRVVCCLVGGRDGRHASTLPPCPSVSVVEREFPGILARSVAE